jgi:hypothetical protein
MEGIEIASARASSEPAKEETKTEPVETVSYPTLRGLDEDGDAKMPGDNA